MFCAFSFLLLFPSSRPGWFNVYNNIEPNLFSLQDLVGRANGKGMIKNIKYKNLWWMREKTTEHTEKMYEQILSGVTGWCRCQVTVEGWVGVGNTNSPDGWRNLNDFCKRVREPKHKWTRLKCQNLSCQALPTLGLNERAKRGKDEKCFCVFFMEKFTYWDAHKKQGGGGWTGDYCKLMEG